MEQQPVSIFKSIVAVVGSFLVTQMLTSSAAKLIEYYYPGTLPQSSLPSPGWIAIVLLYPMLFCFLGGFIAASIARNRGALHGLALGLLVGGVPALVALGRPGQPIWFLTAYVLTTIPAAIAGGIVCMRRIRRRENRAAQPPVAAG